MTSKILLITFALSLVSCASYLKRKNCESINWFEHGKQVALSGKWLNADSVVTECRKVDAEIQESQLDLGFKNGMQIYCSTDYIYKLGKSGDPFSRDLCEGPQINALTKEHTRGVKDYCAKSNGYAAGTSGKKYQDICPKNLETAFLKEYRRGRKKYVQTMINNKTTEINGLEKSITSLRYDILLEQRRLDSLKTELTSLETQKAFVPHSNPAQMAYIENRMSTVSSDISTLNNRISDKESNLRKLEIDRDARRADIGKLQEELPSLENPEP